MTLEPLQDRADHVYQQHFGQPDRVVLSPGRINLIGEHTDYNQGFVLPAAIAQCAAVALGLRQDDEIHLYAHDLGRAHRTNLDSLSKAGEGWSAYLLGVVQQLQQAGYALCGFNAVLVSDVPVGAGMSSSAAVECAMLFALNEVFGLGLDRMAMVRMAQKAENEFVGLQCGIMDMFASMMGRKDHALRLDCRSLEYQYVPLDLGAYSIVLFDTHVKHSLAGGAYNQRRQSCEEAVHYLQQQYPQVASLRDASPEMVETLPAFGDTSTMYARARFVVEENQRVLTACAQLEKHDLEGFGRLMFASHAGLRDLYAVSCPELDLLVDLAIAEPAIAGARMMGGGFGGCTINLVRTDRIEDIFQRFADIYQQHTGKALGRYVTLPEEGTRRVK